MTTPLHHLAVTCFVLLTVDYSYQQLIEERLQDQNVVQGSNVRFTLRLGQTGLEGTWFGPRGPIYANDKFSITNQGYVQILDIQDVTLSDAGLYEFTVNEEKTSAYLSVQAPPPTNGGWGEWGPWSNPPCQATCGPSARHTVIRQRLCDNPAPQNNGAYCPGSNTDSRDRQCAGPCGNQLVNGMWGDWGPWSNPPCPATCGKDAKHTVERQRACDNPEPQNGGSFCSGTSFDYSYIQCNPIDCEELIDGQWGRWSTWVETGVCAASCGPGARVTITRTRECNNPLPANGGKWCVGGTTDISSRQCGPACDEPVDGRFGEWGPWTSTEPCPATCGDTAKRIERRYRQCDSPAPSNGGRDCVGDTSLAALNWCGSQDCGAVVNGGLGPWSPWTSTEACPVTCGIGAKRVERRYRECNNPTPSNGGKDCEGDRSDLAVNQCAPLDCGAGGLSEWSQWGRAVCNVTCGRFVMGVRKRSRTCTKPAPSNGGEACTEHLEETSSSDCTLPFCPINGKWTSWSPWSILTTCPVTCGPKVENSVSRSRSCTNPPPQNGGIPCEGVSIQTINKICAPTCEEHVITVELINQTQPAGGHVVFEVTLSSAGLTGAWYKDGEQIFSSRRVRISVDGMTHRLDIRELSAADSGEFTFSASGMTSSAVLVVEGTLPRNGGWSDWSTWTGPECPATCGPAAKRLMTRNRSCTNPEPADGGKNCTGQSEQADLRDCALPCDGVFVSIWTEWQDETCPVTCGPAMTTLSKRKRTCLTPSGTCDVVLEQTRRASCGLKHCPVNGSFTMWTSWSKGKCHVSCGKDIPLEVIRRRSCTNPRPSYGGATCSGPTEEKNMTHCEIPHCPVHGNFSSWSPWVNYTCSATCGKYATRTAQRARTCTNPLPDHGGRFCTGHLQEAVVRSCHLEDCKGGIEDYLSSDNNGWFIGLIGAIVAVGIMLIIFIVACCVWHCRKESKRRTVSDRMNTWEMDSVSRKTPDYITHGPYASSTQIL